MLPNCLTCTRSSNYLVSMKKNTQNIAWKDVKQTIFNAFDWFRHDELQAKIDEMKKRQL